MIRVARLALAVAVLLEIALYFAVQGDFAGSDPLGYAVIAHNIADRPAETFAAITNHPFDMRIGLTIPLSLLYRGFGVSIPVTNLPSLLGWLLILGVVYAAVTTPRGKLVGLILVVTCRALVQQLPLLYPDLLCAALMGCSVLGLSRRGGPRGAWWITFAALSLVAAFLVKESAVWLGPTWLYALASDLRATGLRATARRFGRGLTVGAALAAGYLVLCARVWGDPLARFAGIQELAGEHTWSMAHAGGAAWLGRLTWQPALLLYKMMTLAIFPALVAPWLAGVRARARIWLVYTATTLLLFWFGSTSLSSYLPLPLMPRMALPVVPGVLVLAALGIDCLLGYLLDSASGRAADAASGRAPDAASDSTSGPPASRWRLPTIAAILAILALAFLLRLSSQSIQSIATRPRLGEALFAGLRAQAADPDRRLTVVCGDRSRVELVRFAFGFSPPPNLAITFAGDYARAPRPEPGAALHAVRVLLYAPVTGTDVPYPDVDLSPWLLPRLGALGLAPLVSRGPMSLYDAGDGASLWEALQEAPR